MTDHTADDSKTYTCPHCGSTLKKWQTPEDSTWGGALKLVCFADECPYFVRGWDVMMEKQMVSASYRYMLDPRTGVAKPLPVWSKEALKNQVIED